MASQVEIANRALTKLGAARIISFGDDNKQARAIQSLYDIVRDAELRSHLWSFSVKRVELAALSSTPGWGFDLEYNLPADYLRLLQVDDIYVGPDMSDYRNVSTAQYMLEGRKILTNFPAPLKIRYQARVVDPTQYDATFVEALASRLAMELAEDLTQSGTKKQAADEDYKRAIKAAIRCNAIEQQPQDLPDNSWALSRL
jgi:hypothetical protein